MKKVRAFTGFLSVCAVVASLTVSFFLYRSVAPELLPWWAIVAGFQFLSIVMVRLSKEGSE